MTRRQPTLASCTTKEWNAAFSMIVRIANQETTLKKMRALRPDASESTLKRYIGREERVR